MRYQFILTLLLLGVVAESSRAVTYDWNIAAGGTYSTAANWTPAGGPPGFNDIARFTLPNTYPVIFTSSPSITSISQSQGNVTLELGTNTFNMSSTTNNVLGSANQTTALRVNNGNFRPNNLNIANSTTSTANLILDLLADARIGNGGLNVGATGTGNLFMLGGATLQTTGPAAIGLNVGSNGTATLTGTDTVWTVSNNPLRVGSFGTGTLNINAGASVTTTGLEVGEELGSVGTISLLGNEATLTAGGTANIGGNTAAEPAASATLNVGLGSTLSLTGTTNLRTNSKVNLNGGTLNLNTLNITAGSIANWTSGTLNFTTGPQITTAVLDYFLSGQTGTRTLGANRTLSSTGGTMTLTSPLELTGGRISVPTFIINSNLEIGPFSSINVANTITVQPGSTVVLHDFATLGGVTTLINVNGGTLLLDGPLANVLGPTNSTTGFIKGTGRFRAGLNNLTNGTIRVETDDHIIIDTGAPSNAGTIELAGGTVQYSGALSNLATGTISGRGVFRGSAGAPGGTGINNSGVMSFSAGITDIFGDVNNAAAGKVVAAGASTVTFFDDVVNNGDIKTVAGSRTVFFGAVSGAGTFTGTGVVEMEGDLKPGNSPANVQFGGDLNLAATAALNIELGGAMKGSQYDSLTIAGAASLSGSFEASLIDGYLPATGQSFEVLTAAGGISGTFDSITLPALAGGLYFNLAYAPTSITLSVAGVLGDYNHSGDIDAADYVLWRKAINQTGNALAADGNRNGIIDAADFNLWRSSYGTYAASSGSGGAIPEPTSLAIATLLIALITPRRRTRAQRRF